MAQADWNDLSSPALDTSKVHRGVSTAFTPPSGGGSFIYAFKSLDTSTGVAGEYCKVSGAAPIPGTKKGGRMSAAIKRYSAGTGYAPFFGLMAGTNVQTSYGYFLGLSNDSSYKICLKKGLISAGLKEGDSDVLRKSTQGYTDSGDGTSGWFHLRLDVLVNPHGEVILSVKRNTGSVTSPSWASIDGMDDYTDDANGILTGSLPYLQGFYFVFGHYTEGSSGATSFVDHIECFKQINP